jgi:hypothetical protein
MKSEAVEGEKCSFWVRVGSTIIIITFSLDKVVGGYLIGLVKPFVLVQTV